MKKNYTVVFLKSKLLLAAFSLFIITSNSLILNAQERFPEPLGECHGRPSPDRPDLAVQQDLKRTKDPRLGYVPRERLASAWQMVQQQKAQKKSTPSPLTVANWTERGPSNIGGRTRALMFDPNDVTNKKVWAGGAGGGLWYTNDITIASPVWVNVDGFWANLAVSSIAYNPANTQEFYVGTGEGWFNADAIQGAGIWKTTNGGSSWSQVSATNNSTFSYVQKIVVTGTGEVLASTRTDGVYRSTDAGSTWSKVLGSGSGATTNRAADLEIGADGTIFATMGLSGSTDGLYSSATGASGTWTKLNTGANGFPVAGFYRVELACAPSNANRLYAMICNSDNTLLDILTSADKGLSWGTCGLASWLDLACASPESDMTRGQAWYNMIIAVDPNNAGTLLIGGVDVMKSTDGGSTWNQLSSWWGGCGLPYIHADQHAIAFQPGSSSVAIFGNDGGIFYSTDVNNSSPTFSSKNTGYNVTQFYSCAMNPGSGSDYFLAGAQDNGTQKFAAAGINTTSEVSGGDGAFCHIDQTDATYQVSSYVYNNFFLSTNGGTSFPSMAGGSNTGDFINPSDYDSPNGILYSSYSATQLQRITGIRGTPSISQFTVPGMTDMAGVIRVSPFSPAGTTTLFVGTQDGMLFKITNAESSPVVTNITGSSFPSGTVSCVEIGASEQDLLVTFFNYGVSSVWRTTDGGTSWSDKDNGSLPDMPVRWAIYNPNNQKEVFLATEVGVWSTNDVTAASPAWAANVTGLANVRVDMFKYRSSDKMLIAATHGRGLFSTNVFAASAPVADFNGSPTTLCIGSSVTFTDATTNTPTGWSWTFEGGNPAASISQNPVVTYTAAGTYSVSLTASNADGSDTKDKTGYITVMGTPSVTITPTPSATICNGASVTLAGSGGTTYSWAPTGETTSAIIAANVTSASDYTLTVANAGGCTGTGTISITVDPIPTAGISVSPSTSVCSGSNITLDASGGSTYVWAPGGQTTTSKVVSNLTTTSDYTLTAISSFGCTDTATVTVTVNPLPTVTITPGPASSICSGSSATLIASGAATYLWTQGQTTSALVVNPVSNTTYTVTGTDAIGCSAKSTQLITITVPAVSINASPSSTVCSGSSATLTASGASAYSWSTGQTGAAIAVSPSGSTTYTVTGTDANGCSKNATRPVTVSSPNLTIAFNPSATICIGSTVTLTAFGASSYVWSGGQNSAAITDSPTILTSYTVTGTNAIGCTKTDSVSVDVNPAPSVSVSVAPSTVCPGANVTLTASGATSYSWSTGQTGSSITQAPTSSSSYTVTGIAGGCGSSASTGVTVNAFSVTMSKSDETCSGNDGTAMASPSGIPPYTYLWSTGGTTQTISGLDGGTYTCTVTDSLGCSNVSSVFVNNGCGIPVAGFSGSPATICAGSPVTFIDGSSNTPIDWSWSFPGGNPSSDTLQNPVVTYTAAGTYSVSLIASNTNGADTMVKTGYITVNAIPSVSIAVTPSATICAGMGVTLSAAGAAAYSWAPGGQTTSGKTVSPAATDTFTVIGVTAGCMDTAVQVVTVNPLPSASVTASPSSTICVGTSAVLTASGGASYLWSQGQTASAITVNPAGNTTYSVTATDTNGCSAKSSILISISNPVISIGVTPSSTICNGSGATLTAAGGVGYSWSDGGQTTTSIVVSPSANTSYTVTATSAFGCTKNISRLITVSSPVISVNTAPSSTVCSGEVVTLSASGGSSYSWLPGGQTTAAISDTSLATATYTVIGANTIGCTAITTKTVEVSPTPTVSVNVSPSSTICNGTTITLSASGALTYSWSPGAKTTSTFSVKPTTSTTYTLIASNGCAVVTTQAVTVNPLPVVVVTPSPSDTVCSGGSTTLTASGASTYLWSAGQTDTSIVITPTSNSNYSVTATDTNGCSVTVKKTITIAAPPSVAIAVSPSATICAGAAATLTGSGALMYSWAPAGQTGSSIVIIPTANTTYTVTGTDARGCTKTNSKSVKISDISVSVYPSDTMCIGAMVKLTASGGTSYSWLPDGQTTAMISDTVSGTMTYTVIGITNAGCSITVQKTITSDPCTGISDLTGHSSVVVYPNPGRGEFMINDLPYPAQMEVYNMMGEKVYGTVLKSKDERLVLDEADGVYFLLIRTDKGAYPAVKIVISK